MSKLFYIQPSVSTSEEKESIIGKRNRKGSEQKVLVNQITVISQLKNHTLVKNSILFTKRKQ